MLARNGAVSVTTLAGSIWNTSKPFGPVKQHLKDLPVFVTVVTTPELSREVRRCDSDGVRDGGIIASDGWREDLRRASGALPDAP